MEIKKAEVTQVQTQISASLGANIGAAGRTIAAAQSEQNSFQQLTNLSVKGLSRALEISGENSAIDDAAADQKMSDEVNTLKGKSRTQMAAIKSQQAIINTKKAAADTEEATDEVLALEADQTKKWDNYATALSNQKESEEYLKEKSLSLDGNYMTVYGKAYDRKAKAIAVNKLKVDLQQTSVEIYEDNKADPVAYAAAMAEYSEVVKETLPVEMQAAWDNSVQQSVLVGSEQVRKNTTKAQNDELAALTIQLQETNQIQTLDASSKGDLGQMAQGLNTTKKLLGNLVTEGIISKSDAQVAYKKEYDDAVDSYITHDFQRQLGDNPAEAGKWLEKFANGTSTKMYGDPKKDDNALAYTTEQRDVMAAEMYRMLKSKESASSANTAKLIKFNNNKLKEEIKTLQEGKTVKGGLDYNQLQAGLNIDASLLENAKIWKHYQPQIKMFNTMGDYGQAQMVKEYQEKTEYGPGERELRTIYEDIHKQNKERIKDRPADAATFHLSPQDKPDYNKIGQDGYRLTDYLGDMDPYAQKFSDTTTGGILTYLTPEQAALETTNYENLSTFEKTLYIKDIVDELGDNSEFYFNELEENGSLINQVYTQIKGGKRAVGEGILRGKELMQDKTLYKNAGIDNVNDLYGIVVGSRGMDADMKSRAALKEAVIAYAVNLNNGGPADEIDQAMMQTAVDTVYGKEFLVNDSWYNSGPEAVIGTYQKTEDDYYEAMENVRFTDEFKDVNFKGLDAKTVWENVRTNRFVLKPTGMDGEYFVFDANGIQITTLTPTGEINDKGEQQNKPHSFKLKLWGNK